MNLKDQTPAQTERMSNNFFASLLLEQVKPGKAVKAELNFESVPVDVIIRRYAEGYEIAYSGSRETLHLGNYAETRDFIGEHVPQNR
jgi:hypothetical protein